jgi:anti-sigma regulatory factor (Ser/Thr protein kinase)
MIGMIEIRLRNQLSEILRLADLVDRFGEAHGLASGVVFKFNLVLDEVLTNIIDYGYDDGAPHDIVVILTLAGAVITAEVIDDGRPYDPTLVPEPDLTLSVDDRPIGGLGIHFARTMMDRVEYRRDGRLNRLRLSRRADPEAAGSAGTT